MSSRMQSMSGTCNSFTLLFVRRWLLKSMEDSNATSKASLRKKVWPYRGGKNCSTSCTEPFRSTLTTSEKQSTLILFITRRTTRQHNSTRTFLFLRDYLKTRRRRLTSRKNSSKCNNKQNISISQMLFWISKCLMGCLSTIPLRHYNKNFSILCQIMSMSISPRNRTKYRTYSSGDHPSLEAITGQRLAISE